MKSVTSSGYCAIDFGTSNSAVAVPIAPARNHGTRLVELEAGFHTMPTAVFYRSDAADAAAEAPRWYGRAAVAAYVDGLEGRLMRSMKSILGSALVEQSTDVGGGRAVKYLDVIAGYLRHLKGLAEAAAGAPIERAVLGRPVYFVDDEPERDAAAQAALARAARQAGFTELAFQYEPIAAALDHERSVQREQLVLVADIGGGTADFSLVRVGPQRAARLDRKDDILANHGVHSAGTDFDRRIELAAILPLFGFNTLGPRRPGEPAREVPSGIYFDLATWHLINTVYTPARLAEWRAMRGWFADERLHRRLMAVLNQRWGHALAAAAEQAKIEVAQQGRAVIDLGFVEASLHATLDERAAAAAIEADVARIVAAAIETARLGGMAAAKVDALYFTGGSTGLQSLVDRIAAGFGAAAVLRGDRFASVASGLGVYAQRLFSR